MLDSDLPDPTQNPNRDAERVHPSSNDSPPRESGAEDPYEGAVPPGYDWPTHGGYLGCLFGLIIACLVGSVIGAPLYALNVHHALSGIVTALLIVAVFAVLTLVIGRLGYVLGKRFLREYPQPQGKTWGEHDDYIDPAAQEQPAGPESETEDQSGGDGSGRAAFLRPPG